MALKINRFWVDLYVEFQSNPFDDRSDKEFCTENGITPETLRRYKTLHRDELFEEINKRRKKYTNEIRAFALKKLMGRVDKDTQALKLAFQLLGDLVEKTESRVEYLSQEDKIRRINDLLKNISQKKSVWATGTDNSSEPRPSGVDRNEPEGTNIASGG